MPSGGHLSFTPTAGQGRRRPRHRRAHEARPGVRQLPDRLFVRAAIAVALATAGLSPAHGQELPALTGAIVLGLAPPDPWCRARCAIPAATEPMHQPDLPAEGPGGVTVARTIVAPVSGTIGTSGAYGVLRDGRMMTISVS